MDKKFADMSIEEFHEGLKGLSYAELTDIHIVMQSEFASSDHGAKRHLDDLFEVIDAKRARQTR